MEAGTARDEPMKDDATFEKMDRMYRFQRHFYDLSRKYYLLGRDKLINQMRLTDGDTVIEVGCGTGRNLEKLSKKHPSVRFFGLDASEEMLKNANKKKESKGLRNVHFEKALADDFTFDGTFGLARPFDAAFFSYSISMIPTWEAAITNALDNIREGSSIYIVDFYDQRSLPSFFRNALQAWLRKFHVKYRGGLIPFLKQLEKEGRGHLTVTPIYKTYSFIAEFKKNY